MRILPSGAYSLLNVFVPSFNPDRRQRMGEYKLGEEFFQHGARLYKLIRILRLPPCVPSVVPSPLSLVS